jgi:hypothetical protein
VTTNWRAGVTYKLYDFRDSCEGVCGARFQGTTHLFDAGAEFQSPRSPNLRVGVALTHAGLALQIRNAAQADPTPARLRLGAAYEIGHLVHQDTAIKIWAHADVIQPLRNAGTPALNIGAEAILNETIYLRAGYAATSYGVTYGGPGVGVGLRYQRFDVSVAKAFSTPLDDDPVQVTFGVRF